MPAPFKRIALIIRQFTPDIIDTLNTLIEHLRQQKLEIILETETAKNIPECKLPTVANQNLKNHCDIIIVIGGDGSLLTAAQFAVKQQLPILGINRGYLGFLTDISPKNFAKINDILQGNYLAEDRYLLAATMQNQQKVIAKSTCLNDVVLLSSIAGHLIEFSVYIDQQFVCAYRADGLIAATATGSTAHALSAGGPILQPELGATLLVPILSHNLSSRPLVVNNKSLIKIEALKNNSDDLRVSCDGHERISLPPGGTIELTCALEKLSLIHPIDHNYFETLRTKLNWERNN